MRLRDIATRSALLENQKPARLYHLTDNAKLVLDPRYAPTDNAVSMHDRSGNNSIYLAPRIEPWVNGHGYWSPFVVEFKVHPDIYDREHMGRWGGEVFVAG